jgi:hypothetical protein
MRASRELLAGDRLGSLARREVRSRPTIREREDIEDARHKLHSVRSPEDLVQRAGALSEHVREQSYLLGSGGFVEGETVEHDRLSVKSEPSENGSDVEQAVQSSRQASSRVPDFVDVTKMSAASRRTAAPHIFNIFEQIFMDNEPSHQRRAIPDLPADVRASMRASGADVEEELGLTGARAEVVMTIDESWQVLTGGTGAPSRFEKQLVADLAIALRIDKSRVQVIKVAPSGAGSRAIAELLILPPSMEGEAPAVEVAEAISHQAALPHSMLHAMSSTRRASNVRYREVQPAVSKAMRTGECGPYQALLQGGVVVDDRGVRPLLSAVHGVKPTQLKQSRNAHDSVAAHERDLQAQHVVDIARRHKEGFWVDVDRSVYQPVQSVNKYGTFRPTSSRKEVSTPPVPFALCSTCICSYGQRECVHGAGCRKCLPVCHRHLTLSLGSGVFWVRAIGAWSRNRFGNAIGWLCCDGNEVCPQTAIKCAR